MKETGRTYYSERFDGNDRNYHLTLELDYTDGFLGLSQTEEGSSHVRDRILLSPQQVKLMLAFIANPKAKQAQRKTPKKR